jgi:hypothetical protein
LIKAEDASVEDRRQLRVFPVAVACRLQPQTRRKTSRAARQTRLSLQLSFDAISPRRSDVSGSSMIHACKVAFCDPDRTLGLLRHDHFDANDFPSERFERWTPRCRAFPTRFWAKKPRTQPPLFSPSSSPSLRSHPQPPTFNPLLCSYLRLLLFSTLSFCAVLVPLASLLRFIIHPPFLWLGTACSNSPLTGTVYSIRPPYVTSLIAHSSSHSSLLPFCSLPCPLRVAVRPP